jgi:1,2-beta-oligoglucan phosphorylase
MSTNNKIELKNRNGLTFAFYSNGKPAFISKGKISVNLYYPNIAEPSISNLYLRILEKKSVKVHKIMGPGSEFTAYQNGFSWEGTFRKIGYRVELKIDDNDIWYTSVQMENMGPGNVSVDLVMAQDIALADMGMVRSNEAYTSQYLDYTVCEDKEYGYIICGRQNLPQSGADKQKVNPWIMLGCLQGTVSYLTDGFDLYTRKCRITSRPEALFQKKLSGKKRQFEFSLAALQTGSIRLSRKNRKSVTFFGIFKDNHPEASSPRDLELLKNIRNAAEALSIPLSMSDKISGGIPADSLLENADWIRCRKISSKGLKKLFPGPWRNVEKINKKTASFFHSNEEHVVFLEKDLVVDRPHGTICFSGSDLSIDESRISTTFWMQGVFQSQFTCGNVNMHRLLSVNRNHLNLLRLSGQRIFKRTKNGWEQLGLPSVFEMGTDFSRWIYLTATHEIAVTSWTLDDKPAAVTELEIRKGKPAEFMITHDIGDGDSEGYDRQVTFDKDKGCVYIQPGTNEESSKTYPRLLYAIQAGNPGDIARYGNDAPFFADDRSRSLPFITLITKPVRKFTLFIAAHIEDPSVLRANLASFADDPPDFAKCRADHLNNRKKMLNGLELESKKKSGDYDSLREIIPWFFHDALVHYLVPHGLEQFGGAAWGVRDVCQGPVELFLSLGHDSVVKDILLKVFSHQYAETGNWPQYFMFDRYTKMQSKDSHGDIIVWPLFSLSLYCEQTGDLSILNEKVPYTNLSTLEMTGETDSMLGHVRRLLNHIETNVLEGTCLSRYEEGDWDDTLQPADDSFRHRMASGWTVPLTYQSLKRMKLVLEKAGEKDLAGEMDKVADQIKLDFQKYFLSDGTAAGFIRLDPGNKIVKLLHPTDEETGIHFRLLPLTRGVISGIFTPQQAKHHLDLVKKNLLAPDGVRLMDRPARYAGGTMKIFKRAELAANFGREIGLMYTHAHIRYVESLAVMGHQETIVPMLNKVNPVSLDGDFTKYLPRQSNAYFSSSDADFPDRYSAEKNYDKVKKGKVDVAGGWRIYSSGPGLWLSRLLCNLIGLRRYFGDLVLDPVMPLSFDGLEIKYRYDNHPVVYRFHIKKRGFGPDEIRINDRILKNPGKLPDPYRKGGVVIPRTEFSGTSGKSIVDIFI